MRDIDNEPPTDLPEGWERCELKELFYNGLIADGDWIETKDQDKNGTVRLIQLSDIGDGLFRDRSNRYITESKYMELNCTKLEKDDILIARMPDPLGRACLFPFLPYLSITAVDIAIFRSNSITIQHYLMRLINSNEIRNYFESYSKGTTRKRIAKKDIENLIIPVAPLEEQKRIVAKIDEVFEQVEAVKGSLEKSKKLVKQFRKAVLTKAFKGELVPTEAELARREGRDYETASQLLAKIKPNKEKPNTKTTTPPINNEPPTDLPEGWEENILKSRVILQGGNAFKSKEYENSGCPIIRISNLKNEIVNCNDVPFLNINKINEYKDFILNEGDILIAMSGATTGKLGIVPSICNNWLLNQRVGRLIIKDKTENKFIYWLLKYKQNDILGKAYGGAQPNISPNMIEHMICNFPPINEQKRIVAKIDELYAFADEIEAQIDFALKRTDTIKQAVLAKAFRGELVITEAELARREGRDYEPASALLEKIKSQAKEISEKPQIRKRTNKKGE